MLKAQSWKRSTDYTNYPQITQIPQIKFLNIKSIRRFRDLPGWNQRLEWQHKGVLAGSPVEWLKDSTGQAWRKTTSLRFVKLRLGKQFMAPGGPVFALASYAPAGDSWRRRTPLRWSFGATSKSWRKTTSPFNWIFDSFFCTMKNVREWSWS